MIQKRLYRELELVAARYRRVRLRVALASVWLVAATVGAGALGLSWRFGWYSPRTAVILGAGAALCALVVCVVVLRRARGRMLYRRLAHAIEARHPELSSRLLAAIEQRPRLSKGRFGYLQATLIREVLAHARGASWHRVVPTRALVASQLGHLAAFALLAGVVTVLAVYGEPSGEGGAAAPSAGTQRGVASEQYPVDVEPGDIELERGDALLVVARFQAAVPAEAALVSRGSTGETRRMPMSRSLDDPLFAGRVFPVNSDLSYHVEFAGQTTRPYRVTVFEYPELERADALLVYPEYTALDDALIEDTRRITVVEGTQVTLICRLNKRVSTARLVDAEAEETIDLARSTSEATLGGVGPALPAGLEPAYTTTLTAARSRRFRLHLTDEAGRTNREPAELIVSVLKNRPPELKPLRPRGDTRVSPVEELTLAARFWDDFGLGAYGLAYALAGQEARDVVLGTAAPAREAREALHLLDFEALGAAPDQLVSYYFWADDAGPDGAVRRTSSDMYFAEVRPFEEIFREGQAPPGGESPERQRSGQAGGPADEAGELAELQKRIVVATWKLIRRETGAEPTAEFASDTALLRESQQSALEQLAGAAERVEDATSAQHIEAVREHMNRALEHLGRATDGAAIDALPPALAAEQAAYQGLLRLRAREHRVTRGGRQSNRGGGGGGQSRSEAQLRQLELSSSENRYETQRTAASPQNQEERETRQTLNRLRELARRQQDVTQRLKELESTLKEADSEEEREEIRRQLKRLRDEEERILRDTDELRERMDRPENQERMADAQRQLDETRSNVRRASEALEEGRLAEAAAAGTRAAREFTELRDEFRRQASNRFSEDVREMRDEATRLDETEQDLAKSLSELNESRPTTLRGTSERQQLTEGLARQKEELRELLERMEETTQQAEEPEPLLSRQLYDTLRKARQENIDDSLELTRQLLERGFVDHAGVEEERARRGIADLRRGIGEAAESVLGDGTEALRRAAEELRQLAEAVGQEADRADPGGSARPRPESSAPSPAADAPTEEATPRGSGPGARQGEGEGTRANAGARQRGGASEAERGRSDAGGLRGGGPGGGADRARLGGLENFLERRGRADAPLTGDDDFRDWSDRLRDVEEMIDDAELRAEAARIRERARGVRAEYKRDFKKPDWQMVRVGIVEPLTELHRRVSEELRRKLSKDARVPIDRDPVPPRYSEQVRRYYERLGSGQ